MRYTIRQIARITGGQLLGEGSAALPVEHLLLDSRRLLFPKTSLFFALRGVRHDGHEFIASLYERGVRCFVVGRAPEGKGFPEAAFVRVDDVVGALQALAAHHRRRFDLPVIGITGSNGKTIVKEWLFQLLQEHYFIVRSPGSYNSQVGVPLSVWQLRPEHELALFEAGISHMGEMERLAPVVRCRIGLLTNIGEAHSEGFPSKEEKLQQKLQLFRYAECIIYCRDQPLVDRAVRALGKPVFSWSRERAADLRIAALTTTDGQTTIAGEYRGATYRIAIPFTDPASIENAIHCWAVLLYLGLPPAQIRQRMARLTPIAMRLELKEGIQGSIVINDSYNADLNSLANALHFLDQQRRRGRRTLILSDILQSGQDERALYRQVARLIREKEVDRLFAIGREVPVLAALLPKSVEAAFFPDTDAFLRVLGSYDFHGDVVLLKGARAFAFERIAQRLAQQVHLTTLEIDLDALVHNLHTFGSRLRPGVRTMVMVKASAYGSGSVEVAKLLEFHQVDYLAVAYTDEGVELRQAGIRLPILVLNPEPVAFEALLRFRLEPEIFSLPQLEQFAEFTAPYERVPPIHLNLDTGMRRLGFDPGDLPALLQALDRHRHLRVQSVFSHLAASEAPEHDAFTIQQWRRYTAGYEQLAAGLGYRPLRHLLNSSGIHRFPDYQLDMVRLGIGIYGIDSAGILTDALQPVFHFKTHVAQLKNLAAGESIGYGRRGARAAARRIATLSVGYADGLPRAAGNERYQVLIRGRRAPLVGSICMDMCMVDVSHLPEVREGDEVTLFGRDPRVEELAAVLDTIPYEVLTGISRRVKRVYVQG